MRLHAATRFPSQRNWTWGRGLLDEQDAVASLGGPRSSCEGYLAFVSSPQTSWMMAPRDRDSTSIRGSLQYGKQSAGVAPAPGAVGAVPQRLPSPSARRRQQFCVCSGSALTRGFPPAQPRLSGGSGALSLTQRSPSGHLTCRRHQRTHFMSTWARAMSRE